MAIPGPVLWGIGMKIGKPLNKILIEIGILEKFYKNILEKVS